MKKPEPRRLPYVQRLERRGGVSVCLVDGAYVRKNIDEEFSNFGHHHEVWIDDDLHEDERGFVLFHELHERNLMANGMDYDTAHDAASRLERHYRNHLAELHEALAREGWE